MRSGIWVIGLALAGSMAAAEDAWLDGAAITGLLTGATLTYDDGSNQVFNAGGGTVYTKDRPSTGRWQVRGDRYCSVWPPSDVWACYDVTNGAGAIGFVADDGSVILGQLQP